MIDLKSFESLLDEVEPLIENVETSAFLDYIKKLDGLGLSNLIENPKPTNRENFLEAILQYLDYVRFNRTKIQVIENIFKKFGQIFLNELLENIFDSDWHVRISVLEAILLIDEEKIAVVKKSLFTLNLRKDIYETRRFKYDGFNDPPKLVLFHILAVLSKFFEEEEFFKYLDKFHKNELKERFDVYGGYIRGIINDIFMEEVRYVREDKLRERLEDTTVGKALKMWEDDLTNVLLYCITYEYLNEDAINLIESIGDRAVEKLKKHLKSVISTIDLNEPYEYNYMYYDVVKYTRKLLGDKFLIQYLNSQDYHRGADFLWPYKPQSPLFELRESVEIGLKSEDNDFYIETIKLLKNFLWLLLKNVKKFKSKYWNMWDDGLFTIDILQFLYIILCNLDNETVSNIFSDIPQSLKDEFKANNSDLFQDFDKYGDRTSWYYYNMDGRLKEFWEEIIEIV